MPRKTKYNWSELFTEFETLDISQSAFCAEKGINLKYFNLCYSKHRKQNSNKAVPVGFVEVRPVSISNPALRLIVGNAVLHFPPDTDPAYIGQILRYVS